MTTPQVDARGFVGAWLCMQLGRGGPTFTPASAVVQHDRLVLRVGGAGASAITMTLEARGDSMVGRATIGAGPQSREVAVEVFVEGDGSQLRAVPAGYANMEEWHFKRP